MPIEEHIVKNAIVVNKHMLTIYERKFSLKLDSDMTDNNAIHVEKISILLGLQAWDRGRFVLDFLYINLWLPFE